MLKDGLRKYRLYPGRRACGSAGLPLCGLVPPVLANPDLHKIIGYDGKYRGNDDVACHVDRRKPAGIFKDTLAVGAVGAALGPRREGEPRRLQTVLGIGLVAVVIGLIGFGVVMVYSSSAVEATVRHHDPQYFLVQPIAYDCKRC